MNSWVPFWMSLQNTARWMKSTERQRKRERSNPAQKAGRHEVTLSCRYKVAHGERDRKAFISMKEYRKKVLGNKVDNVKFDKEDFVVTLEISACNILNSDRWGRESIKNQDLMPGRYIRVRNMKEQEKNKGELIAVGAAMNIVGASFVETLDTRGTDGSNVHLGGPDTITGYFGGVGQPNHYAWSGWKNFCITIPTMESGRFSMSIRHGTPRLYHS